MPRQAEQAKSTAQRRSALRFLPVVLLALALALCIAPAFESMAVRSLSVAQSSPFWGLLIAFIAGLLFRFRHHLFTPTPRTETGHWPERASSWQHTR
jgi:hypothetical protein